MTTSATSSEMELEGEQRTRNLMPNLININIQISKKESRILRIFEMCQMTFVNMEFRIFFKQNEERG
ncbi:6727_t:CDS:2 [Entrophospora sp. SA101]|nr:6727_t:CDS:2 [Entrophospora sp. SA101]